MGGSLDTAPGNTRVPQRNIADLAPSSNDPIPVWLVFNREQGENPVRDLLEDPPILFLGFLWLAITVLVERLFVYFKSRRHSRKFAQQAGPQVVPLVQALRTAAACAPSWRRA